MSGPALIALALATALVATRARAEDPPTAALVPAAELPAELRETLPGGSRAGAAPELPAARIDVLPQPTQIRIHVRRRAAPQED